MTSLLLKTEGAGNDFLIGTGRWCTPLAGDAALVERLCHRRLGIGADGTLAVSVVGPNAIRLVHRNADGSPSAFCANGTRCAAKVAVEYLGCAAELVIQTDWAAIAAVVDTDTVTLELPPPPAPLDIGLDTEDGRVVGTLLEVGVPHLVIPSSGLDRLDMRRVAAPLRHHPSLGPAGANIHLVETGGDGVLAIRSFERGVPEEVLCCGSGVVAAALVSLQGTGDRTLEVRPRSGDILEVEALGRPPSSASRITGPARLVAVVEPVDASDDQQHR